MGFSSAKFALSTPGAFFAAQPNPVAFLYRIRQESKETERFSSNLTVLTMLSKTIPMKSQMSKNALHSRTYPVFVHVKI